MIALIISLLIFSPIFSKECSSQPLAPALYAFGDSLSDAGNNNFHSWVARANYPPYGKNFPTGITGRFSDGKTFVDFIAGYLGLPYPPAYRKIPRSTTGYTYASAGCGILPETGSTLGCLSLDGQLDRFQKTIENELTQKFESPTELSEYLANSVFVIWAGSNDYLLNYFSDPSPGYNPEAFAQVLINSLSEKLKILHELGARKVVVLEVGPLGCLPVYRKPGGHDEAWCDVDKNKNATMFNELLSSMIQDLATTFPDSLYTLGKLYDLTTSLFKNPTDYGMSNVSHSCCVTGEILGHLACYPNIKPCANPEKYLFWDGAHPTQASHNILASACFNGSDICVPNIQQLVQPLIKSASLHSAA